jgi:hypothetical protein
MPKKTLTAAKYLEAEPSPLSRLAEESLEQADLAGVQHFMTGAPEQASQLCAE